MRIKNTGWSLLVIPLPKDKSISLPARGSTEINQEDFKSPECQRLFAKGTIILLPEKGEKQSG